ncbi:TPA: beta strand repeat-containing protein, partial [Haemophilus influenzae]
NIVLSAKEGEAEIGGVISAQNQQAKGGKLMITGDKVTLKTGAVIDLSGKEGGETYLGGDERGEGKNGIQLAKKTTLEKGSTINVSGKEKGGRAIVWGDIALINGNINAQGSDIAKTGGFVETSGHHLSIDDNVIVKTKEWLLDPDNVEIKAPDPSRVDTDPEFPVGDGSQGNPKRNHDSKTILTNTTISNFLRNAKVVNITAVQTLTVNGSIDIQNGNLTLHTQRGGIKVNADITSSDNSSNSKLNIHSGSWLDIHSNISLGESGSINITAANDIAFERGVNQVIKGQGVITSGNSNGFRFNNVSINGTGSGLMFNSKRSTEGNISNKFEGTLNISGKVKINMVSPSVSWVKRVGGRSHWNVTTLNVAPGSSFDVTIDSRGNTRAGTLSYRSNLNGISFNKDTTFNVAKGSRVGFNIKTSIIVSRFDTNYALFNGNVSVLGGGSVDFNVDASSSTYATSGVTIKSQNFNVSEGSSLNFKTSGSTSTAFLIENDLTLNASGGGNITLRQIEGTDAHVQRGVVAKKNITFTGGNITFGSQKALTEIKGNVTVDNNTNATLRGANFNENKSALNITGNVINKGNLTTDGSIINIGGNLTVENNAHLQAVTNFTFNVSGKFDNKGDSNISIAKGGVRFKDIENTKNLSISTNSSSTYSAVIEGNITNKKGDLNITDNKANAEIQIGGNISQKEGNLTISSDKVNITKQITIKAGVEGESSSSSTASDANLTIKTKELKLTNDLNISGFNKAEITAKGNSDLIIGEASDGNAKKVTFDKVKDSKISADGHNVTLNSKVETSSSNGGAESNSDNDTGLTITAKNVEVNKDITSLKTVNITASEKVTTTAGSTINATNGKASITTKTGDISGTISGNTVSVSASGDLTTKSGSKIEAKSGEANVTSATGTIGGTISGNTVNVTATTDSLTVKGSAKINATKGAATLTASSGKLTTEASSRITSAKGQVNLSAQDGSVAGSINAANVTLNTTGTLTTVEGSSINANSGTLVINAQDATLNGDASGDRTEVNATNASGSGSVTAKTSSSVNITGDLNTVNGLNIISKDGRNTVRLRGKEIEVKYIQPGVASVEEVIEAKRVLEKVKDLSDEERETLAKLGVSAVRFVEPNNTITVNTQNEFTTRPSSQVIISEGKACFSSGNGAAVCTNVADDGQP